MITPAISKELAHLLEQRGWTRRRIATTISANGEFVRRVQAGIQSFSAKDLKLIGRATGVDAHRLLFDALRPMAIKSGGKALYDSTLQVLDFSDRFAASLRASPGKKRLSKKTAA